MTCVIVNDASCSIDLRKGSLPGVVCGLPCRFAVPWPVRACEVPDLSEVEWRALDEAGLMTYDLTLEEVGQALSALGAFGRSRSAGIGIRRLQANLPPEPKAASPRNQAVAHQPQRPNTA